MIRSRISFKQCIHWLGSLAICRRSFLTAPQVDRLTSQCSHLISKTSKGSLIYRSGTPAYVLSVAASTTTDSVEGATYAAEVEGSGSDNEISAADLRAGSLEEMCERALEAAVAHVPTLGWSRDSLEAACMELDLPPGLHSIAMPRGPIDLVLYFYESRNHHLADVLAKWRKEDVADGKNYIIAKPNSFGFEAPPPFKTKQETDTFLHRAIEHRLRANDEVYPQWGQAMGLLTLPQYIPAAIGLEAQLVDEIWAQAGDRSVDMNWYAKRLGLAYVYKLTELFYIQDTSPDHKATWDFLDRRIADLRAMKEAKLKGVASMLREGVFAAGHVTSNILGWSCSGR
ncbi:Ubiquinone biosynthesi protein COQ9 mitochondrial [Taenia solium]|eukprot:TsM_000220300 transcript=TsM_000220300 gene=TsM_000220300